MNPRLEHANLVVRDVNVMIRFIQTALPEFRIRHEGKSEIGGSGYILGPTIPTLRSARHLENQPSVGNLIAGGQV